MRTDACSGKLIGGLVRIDENAIKIGKWASPASALQQAPESLTNNVVRMYVTYIFGWHENNLAF